MNGTDTTENITFPHSTHVVGKIVQQDIRLRSHYVMFIRLIYRKIDVMPLQKYAQCEIRDFFTYMLFHSLN